MASSKMSAPTGSAVSGKKGSKGSKGSKRKGGSSGRSSVKAKAMHYGEVLAATAAASGLRAYRAERGEKVDIAGYDARLVAGGLGLAAAYYKPSAKWATHVERIAAGVLISYASDFGEDKGVEYAAGSAPAAAPAVTAAPAAAGVVIGQIGVGAFGGGKRLQRRIDRTERKLGKVQGRLSQDADPAQTVTVPVSAVKPEYVRKYLK